MGAKDWMVFYAEADIPGVLAERPAIDRDATQRLVEQLFPNHRSTPLDDVTMVNGNPPEDEVYAAVWPGAAVVCSDVVAIDRPSTLNCRFIEAGAGRTIYLHAMHSVVDWLAFAIWEPDGQLRRALSLSPDSGVMENLGEPLPFEAPFWAGDRPATEPDDDIDYPFAFHPLEFGEEALESLFGFVYEGIPSGETIDPEHIGLAAYALKPHQRGIFSRHRGARHT
jgi:hypothetical protein